MSDQPKKQELPLERCRIVAIDEEDGLRMVLSEEDPMGEWVRHSDASAALSDNEAKDARIAELERTNTWVADKRAMKMWQTRAEAAEAKLKSVEGMLASEEKDHRISILLPRLRAIVEGK